MRGRLLAAALLLACLPAARAGGFAALAPGAYVLSGPTLSAAAPPPGEAGNVGLVVGHDAALVIDTGASHRQGRALVAAVRAKTRLPVRAALVSQALPEFLFGATALQQAGIPIVAERRTADLIAQRCRICLDRFERTYGKAAMAGSRVPVPDRTVEADTTVDLGGREVELIDFGWASTPGDVAVYDRASGVFYAGGLVVIGRIPVLRDAQLPAWIAALDRIAALAPRRIVPGHGPVVGPERLAALRGYLVALDAEVRRLYAAQASLTEAIDRAALPRYRGWAGYPEVHRQNVQALYLALEQAELGAGR